MTKAGRARNVHASNGCRWTRHILRARTMAHMSLKCNVCARAYLCYFSTIDHCIVVTPTFHVSRQLFEQNAALSITS